MPVNYVSSGLDNYIYNSYLSVGNCVVTLEEVKVKFGDKLDMLYSQVHTSTGKYDFQYYMEDVPMRYSSTVYNNQNEIVHMVNDIVYDSEGNIVYAHRKGEVMQDENGNPIPVDELELNRYLNLLFVDYKVTLTTVSIKVEYRDYLKKYLTEKIVENAKVVQNQLLDNSKAYVVVPKNIGSVNVKTPTRETFINSMQSFSVNVYVNSRVYNDIETRNSIEYTIISEIDQYLYERTLLSKTELLNTLYEKLKEFVNSVSLDRFTELNEEYLEILNSNARISLSKVLSVDSSGYDIRDDVNVSFILV